VSGTRYAQGTSVTPEATQQEIARAVRRYGASGFVVGWEANHAAVRFRFGTRTARFDLVLPAADDAQFRTSHNGTRRRSAAQVQEAHEAEVRRLWRTLLLVIKAKLEVVALGITSFEEEFLANLELADGSTVGARVIAEVDRALQAGYVPPALLALPPGNDR
jgi:hypothetical protein